MFHCLIKLFTECVVVVIVVISIIMMMMIIIIMSQSLSASASLEGRLFLKVDCAYSYNEAHVYGIVVCVCVFFLKVKKETTIRQHIRPHLVY